MVVEVKKEYENFYQVVGAKIQIMQIDGVSSLLQEGKTVEVNYAGEMRSLLAQSGKHNHKFLQDIQSYRGRKRGAQLYIQDILKLLKL